jgi:hypothetical protein
VLKFFVKRQLINAEIKNMDIKLIMGSLGLSNILPLAAITFVALATGAVITFIVLKSRMKYAIFRKFELNVLGVIKTSIEVTDDQIICKKRRSKLLLETIPYL